MTIHRNSPFLSQQRSGCNSSASLGQASSVKLLRKSGTSYFSKLAVRNIHWPQRPTVVRSRSPNTGLDSHLIELSIHSGPCALKASCRGKRKHILVASDGGSSTGLDLGYGTISRTRGHEAPTYKESQPLVSCLVVWVGSPSQRFFLGRSIHVRRKYTPHMGAGPLRVRCRGYNVPGPGVRQGVQEPFEGRRESCPKEMLNLLIKFLSMALHESGKKN